MRRDRVHDLVVREVDIARAVKVEGDASRQPRLPRTERVQRTVTGLEAVHACQPQAAARFGGDGAAIKDPPAADDSIARRSGVVEGRCPEERRIARSDSAGGQAFPGPALLHLQGDGRQRAGVQGHQLRGHPQDAARGREERPDDRSEPALGKGGHPGRGKAGQPVACGRAVPRARYQRDPAAHSCQRQRREHGPLPERSGPRVMDRNRQCDSGFRHRTAGQAQCEILREGARHGGARHGGRQLLPQELVALGAVVAEADGAAVIDIRHQSATDPAG